MRTAEPERAARLITAGADSPTSACDAQMLLLPVRRAKRKRDNSASSPWKPSLFLQFGLVAQSCLHLQTSDHVKKASYLITSQKPQLYFDCLHTALGIFGGCSPFTLIISTKKLGGNNGCVQVKWSIWTRLKDGKDNLYSFRQEVNMTVTSLPRLNTVFIMRLYSTEKCKEG